MPRIITTDSRSSTVNSEGYSARSTEGGTTRQRAGTTRTTQETPATRTITKDDKAFTISFRVPVNGIC